jgi:hypothetical protein
MAHKTPERYLQRKKEAYARMKIEHPNDWRAYIAKQHWKSSDPNYHKKLREKITIEVFSHYSGGKPTCAKCGFSEDIRGLTLDYIKSGHTRNGVPHGEQLYRKLKREGYPEGWQVLCGTCQFIKRRTNDEWANQYTDGSAFS